MRVNIVCYSGSQGLRRDTEVLASALTEAGMSVTLNNHRYSRTREGTRMGPSRLASKLERAVRCGILRSPVFDINLFLERVTPAAVPLARVNCLIPNPEWFKDEYHVHLQLVDVVLCKTRQAQRIFSELGCTVEYIGFTSIDRKQKGVGFSEGFFHLAGSSAQKGTHQIVNVWRQHPEWPLLVVVQDPTKASPVGAPNIEFVLRRLPDQQLQCYQNQYRTHLCLSEAEGFGHYIVEAMSCSAITLVTDAPPMNEIVAPDRGVLVGYADTSRQRLGTNYYVDPVDLEAKVYRVLNLDRAARERMGAAARQWFETNDRLFRTRFAQVLGAY